MIAEATQAPAPELDRRGATPERQLLAMFDVVADEISAGGYRGCRFVNAAAELHDPAHPARAVISAHQAAVLALIARRGSSQPDLLAPQLKVLLEGVITTALVDPSPQAARDARLAAAALLAHASGEPRARGGRHKDPNRRSRGRNRPCRDSLSRTRRTPRSPRSRRAWWCAGLWRSGPERTARRALAVDFAPGAAWPGVDEHEPGPEEVFVVSGTFTGLTGPGSRHDAGTFIHCDAGTSHSPARRPAAGSLSTTPKADLAP